MYVYALLSDFPQSEDGETEVGCCYGVKEGWCLNNNNSSSSAHSENGSLIDNCSVKHEICSHFLEEKPVSGVFSNHKRALLRLSTSELRKL